MRIAFRLFALVASAFVLTSAIMFWLPVIRGEDSYDVYDYTPSQRPSYDFYPYSEELQKRTPAFERFVQDLLFAELKDKRDDEILRLEAAGSDVCKNGSLTCSDLSAEKAQRVVQAVLKDRAIARERANSDHARNATWISAISMFIALVALIFAGLTYRHKVSVDGTPGTAG
jgi:hypothetical protein